MPQIVRQTDGCVHTVRAGGLNGLAGDDGAVQIGAGGDDHGFCVINGAKAGLYAGDLATVCKNLHDLRLLQLQIVLQFQGVLHILLILPPVALGAQRMNSRAFALVQHPILDTGEVSRKTHLTAQRIQLPDQMALACAADGRVAGHIAHRVQIDGKNDGVKSQPGSGQRRFNACVAGADDSYITFSCVIHSGFSFFSSGITKGLHTTSHRLMGVPRAWNFSS